MAQINENETHTAAMLKVAVQSSFDVIFMRAPSE
jgi:hypothetical protein